MSDMDSSDDFFNNFDSGSPAKLSSSLKPPTSGNNAAVAAKPRPPPPPPRRPTAPVRTSAKPPTTATTAATATRKDPSPPTTATQPALSSASTTQFYAASQQQQYRPATPPTAAASSSSYPSTQRGDSSESKNSGGSAPLRVRPASRKPQPSRIATGGTRSVAAASTAASGSYYGQQQQQQQQQPTSPVSRSGSAGQFQNTHLTTAPAPPQPTMFNPAAAAASSAYLQSNNNYYGNVGGNTMQQQTEQTEGDWFNPDMDVSDDTAPLIPQQNQQPVVPQRKPFVKSTIFRSASSLEGNMDGAVSGGPAPAIHSMFVPTAPTSGAYMVSGTSSSSYNEAEFENEPPLLDELGINIGHILAKTKAVVVPFKRFSGEHSALMDPAMIVEDADLAGPTAFALLLGGELLLTGKIHFGYIYGFGVFGCLAMTLILNLMSPSQAVSVWTVTSILGYSLIPVNLLAAVKIILVNIANLSTLGQILALLTILWSTTASTRLLEVGCGMRDQRYLLAYPIALLYSAFVLITIF